MDVLFVVCIICAIYVIGAAIMGGNGNRDE